MSDEEVKEAEQDLDTFFGGEGWGGEVGGGEGSPKNLAVKLLEEKKEEKGRMWKKKGCNLRRTGALPDLQRRLCLSSTHYLRVQREIFNAP